MTIRPGKPDFILTEGNAEAYAEMRASLCDPDEQTRIAVCGPQSAGKSTLLHELANALQQVESESAFVCTGADIGMAIFIGADESFLERIGSVKALFIDSFDLLLAYEDGQQTAQLLLDERERLGLDTVIASMEHLPNSGLEPLLQEALGKFKVYYLQQLDFDGRSRLARSYADIYSGEGSPVLLDEACEYMASIEGFGYRDMENAAHFLMKASGLESGSTIGREQAGALLR